MFIDWKRMRPGADGGPETGGLPTRETGDEDRAEERAARQATVPAPRAPQVSRESAAARSIFVSAARSWADRREGDEPDTGSLSRRRERPRLRG